ncbi:RNA polymerase subunit sigma-70 [Microbispora rosea]|uniref:RNA polymerase subunit sigma-70 n=1 Tax=Microbispora rosea TaxID=58117 RepID=UPI0037A24F68
MKEKAKETLVEEEPQEAAAAAAGDAAAFSELCERYRGELRVHCYRMLGSLDDAEDQVQETFLRAWRGRAGFAGRATFRAWLYRIATNACLDALERLPRRVLPHHLEPASEPGRAAAGPRTDIPWLQPFPDRLLEEDGPGGEVVDRETIELAFLAALQHLPPRQRAALILRDVLARPGGEIADLLGTSLPAVNSALQRARTTMRRHLPARRADWPRATAAAAERDVLRRLMAAYEAADAAAVAALLAGDARSSMPPYPFWFEGREAITAPLADSFDPASPGFQGRFRMLPVGANRQPAVASYARRPGDAAYRAFALTLVRVEGGLVAEITSFGPELFAAFGLAPAL